MLQYLSAPAEKTSGWEKELLLSFIVHFVCSQSGSDWSPLSTATRSAVRGLIAAAAEREEKRLSTRQALSSSCAKPSLLAFQLSATIIAVCASSVPRTTDPWPWFPLKPCLLQDLSASNTNTMRVSKPLCGRFLAGGKRR